MKNEDTNYLPIALVIIVLVVIVLGVTAAFSWGGGMMGMMGGGFFMFIPFLFILLLILFVVGALDRRPTQYYAPHTAYQPSEDPLLVLNQRFARGEITRDLYLQMKSDILGKGE